MLLTHNGRKTLDQNEKEVKDNPVSTQVRLKKIFASIAEVVLEKNRRYGDSTVSPLKVFSVIRDNEINNESVERICRRLDEKLQRIKNNMNQLQKNDVMDVIGYLALLCNAKDWTDFSDQLD